jgi:hypothetical protein
MTYRYLKLAIPTTPPTEEYVPIDPVDNEGSIGFYLELCDGAYTLADHLASHCCCVDSADAGYGVIIGNIAKAVELLGKTSGTVDDIPWALVSAIPGEPDPEPAPAADAPVEERLLHACANLRCTTTITPTP